ncbi:MAG TPA: hypothetical protein PLE74_11255 [Candidatus Cloacimonadota bacterium]|nr:hypothetical protein [Candidatus Cloacimonadota bacterium]
MSYQAVISKAPLFLRKRFSSLRDYTGKLLYDHARVKYSKDHLYWKKGNDSRRAKIIDQAALAYFIVLQKTFYERTTDASKETVKCFKEFDIPEFVIGSAKFHENSEDVLRGDLLAEALFECITDENVKCIVNEVKYVQDIVDHFKEDFLKLGYMFDQAQTQKDLLDFFGAYHAELESFGRYVNQTFEAYALAQTIKWYLVRNWKVSCVNPKGGQFKLKFNTRGKPVNYSYFILKHNRQTIHIRHQFRVGIRHNNTSSANINLDVAVYKKTDLTKYLEGDFLPNQQLISFGEAKHMSAYAELMANFIGMVHELMPENLNNVRNKDGFLPAENIPPFMIVSGILFHTAKELKSSIIDRGYDIDIYDYRNKICLN